MGCVTMDCEFVQNKQLVSENKTGEHSNNGKIMEASAISPDGSNSRDATVAAAMVDVVMVVAVMTAEMAGMAAMVSGAALAATGTPGVTDGSDMSPCCCWR